MAHVEQLKPRGDFIFAVPYNIRDGSGAPTRAFALPSSAIKQVCCRCKLDFPRKKSFPPIL